jgi:putative membrane protein
VSRVGEAAFFSEAARKGVTEGVVAVEAQTSAEIVVVVRRGSATYREVELVSGLVVAFAALLLLLFHPMPVAVAAMPLDVLLAFAVGAVPVWGLGPVKRALLARRRVDDAVRTRARAAFVEQGVSRTTGRTGILVFVSMLERRVELVCDVGVDAKLVEAPAAAMTAALAATDLEAFFAALRTLGPCLGGSLPRAADDVNELPDAPVMP